MTLFDIIGLVILSVSTLVGIARGALREVTTVVSLAIGVAAAIFALPFTGPFARAAVQPAWAANTVAIVVVFLGVYILARVLAASLTRGVHGTQTLGAVDRLIGAGFGGLRGLALLGLLNLAFNVLPPPSGVPDWVRRAKLYPLSSACARTLLAVAPQGSAMAGRLAPAITRAVIGAASTPPARSAIGQSEVNDYSHAGRKGLDDAVETSR